VRRTDAIALFADSRAPGTSVNVDTNKGMVSLRGKVATDDEKKAAEQVARGIEGVQTVRNELKMVPGSAKKVVEAKDGITKQVKDCFKEAPKLKSLDVRTDNGVVTLQGKLPTIMDSARASQRAREVPDVRSVRNDTTSDSPKVSLDTDRPVGDAGTAGEHEEAQRDRGHALDRAGRCSGRSGEAQGQGV
jgi:hyperosmotically inducible periplasmic protein